VSRRTAPLAWARGAATASAAAAGAVWPAFPAGFRRLHLGAVSRFDLSTLKGRLAAYGDYLWKDHAYLRLPFQNAHWVDKDLIRTNQPWPFQLKWWRERGVNTVINLRGGGFETSFYVLERDACRRLGLTLVDFAVSSREAPSKAQVAAAANLFETVKYPAVMHCKSGADRAGVMSVLYAHLKMGLPLREAVQNELNLRHLHVKQGLTGVLDYAFERYFEQGEPLGLSFAEWVETDAYDPVELKASFRAGRVGQLVTETVLRRE
jgi:protein tyrosine/serine phosphatase